MGSSVALYSRKVLIQTKATDILPKWLRFMRGVVDSEDIPLNLSRELLQESALIRKLSDVIVSKLLRFFLTQSKKDEEKFNMFMKEGQKEIFFMYAPNRQLAESSPYYEALKEKDVE